MAEEKNTQGEEETTTPLSDSVGKTAERKIAARNRMERSIWFGLGMFGLVGWSVAIPTLIGIGIGVWLDKQWPGNTSWTLTMLIIGVALGCANAWHWVQQEGRHTRDDEK